MPTYTTDELLEDMKSRINVPTSEDSNTDARYLRILTRALYEEIVPHYMGMQSNFFLRSSDYDQPSDGVLAIPIRAIGLKVKDVTRVDGDNESNIPMIDAGNRRQSGFFFRDSRIIFSPSYYPGGTIRLWYFQRPGYLSAITDCAQVSSINTGASQVTFTSVPSTWTTTTKLDVIMGLPGFRTLAEGVTATVVAGPTFTFSSLPSGLAVGDWYAPQYHSPIAQIPVEGHGLLAQKGARRVVAAMQDQAHYQITKQDEDSYVKENLDTSDPRADSRPKVIVGRAWSQYRNGFGYRT